MDYRVLRGVLQHHPIILTQGDMTELRTMGLLSIAQTSVIREAQAKTQKFSNLLEPIARKIHGAHAVGPLWSVTRWWVKRQNTALIARLRSVEMDALVSLHSGLKA